MVEWSDGLTTRLSDRVDADFQPLLVLVLELDLPVHQGEEGVVRRTAHVGAGMKLGAPLPHQDMAGPHVLAPEPLDAEVLGIRVAPVARGADTLLVRHDLP